MTQHPSLLIAIPTYNERENVGSLLPRLLEHHPGAHVLVVDDSSPDGTGDVVAALGKRDERIRLMRRAGKQGIGSAYRAAFGWAVREGYALVVEMDADGSHDPAELGRLLEAASAADVVIGSRYIRDGRIENWPLSRLALSWVGNALARVFVGPQVRDWTSGFKCYRREVLEALRLDRITSEGYSFQIEILFHCHRDGWKLREVPITFKDRHLGRSKMSRREVYQAVATLFRIAWQRISA
jgi:glycosyltransferase involved in cell wall biosynthesis